MGCSCAPPYSKLNTFSKMETYNVFYFDIQLNAKPLTLRKAQNLQSSCVINHGYRPEIVPIQEPEKQPQQ